MADVEEYDKLAYKSFNDFVSHGLNMRIITFPRQSSEWKQARCSCYTFDNSFMCIHIISIANTLGFLSEESDEESDYDDEPLLPTKKGRPKKTTKALVKE